MTKSVLRWLVGKVSQGNSDAPLAVQFADGSRWKVGKGSPDITIVFKTRRSQWRSVLFDQSGLLEAYLDGDIEFRGPDALAKLVHYGYNAGLAPDMRKLFPVTPLQKIRQLWLEARNNNKSYPQAKRNAESHYARPYELFESMLSPVLNYAEGYYVSGKETLAQAQKQRSAYIARKLWLKPGQKVVEVGAGWGGDMDILMAEKYGVEVVNYGLVEAQNKIMRQRIAEKGLSDKINIVTKDHRELLDEPETYDRYVSVGIYEHAGKDCQEDWIKSIAVSLKPGGIGMISALCIMHPQLINYVISRHVFPGGNFPSLPRTLDWMEKHGLVVLDIENLSYHYARALKDWYDNFVKDWPKIQKTDPAYFNDRFFRLWSLYLLGSYEALVNYHDDLNLYHIVFSKGEAADYPKTRNFLYE